MNIHDIHLWSEFVKTSKPSFLVLLFTNSFQICFVLW